VLADPAVEAVLLCLPSALHAEVAEAAFRAGKHVYLEKPVAIDLAAAGRVAEAWRASGRVGMVGLNYRHDARHRALRDAVGAEGFGPVAAVRTVFCSSRPAPDWKRRRASGGGVLLDLLSHHADLARFVLGEEVASVSATLRSLRSEADTAGVRMVLGSGVVIESLFSLCAADDDRFEVYGADARLTVDRYRSPVLEREPAGFAYGRGAQGRRELRAALRGLGRVARAGGEPSYRRALQAFVRAARQGGRPGADIGDGVQALRIVLAAEASAHSGRAVEPWAL
jgi:myo-inositol 2-dehydrogenase/D-chiro-inositol 1-dehydrogenase